MYASVIKVTPNEEYQLFVEFNNGQKGILDMKPYLNFGVFNQIKDPEVFKTVHVAFDTVEWDCGVDLDPEFVTKKCIPVSTP